MSSTKEFAQSRSITYLFISPTRFIEALYNYTIETTKSTTIWLHMRKFSKLCIDAATYNNCRNREMLLHKFNLHMGAVAVLSLVVFIIDIIGYDISIWIYITQELFWVVIAQLIIREFRKAQERMLRTRRWGDEWDWNWNDWGLDEWDYWNFGMWKPGEEPNVSWALRRKGLIYTSNPLRDYFHFFGRRKVVGIMTLKF
ncbi:hypothetical protein GLAREA_03538 [Glarea lozoyensis ATCC 20868]|uniref:Uncharacterized protein n=1 Tax=Glarea lozoyensis (strain ATCC 20868 / MF5171) TaxID=1116229 RepID=S3DF08_GLAL2|nr:uncharacterized protein GLAREA_03538 [Glarea lozoyensis ATCC 20868]EPE30571.1 hypothetical protein GLAREA_03538 [Glarea lozoyensis ATCC 20868]